MDEEVKKVLEEYDKRIRELENRIEGKPGAIEKYISLKEFLLSKKPNKDVLKTLAIGYYLEHHQQMVDFNSKDLENGFRQAKEAVPENINYKVIKNIEVGHMMEAKEKKEGLKAWTLTNTGEKFVENNFKKGE